MTTPKVHLALILFFLFVGNHTYGQCSGDIWLRTQAEVDNFDCTVVTGNLTIGGGDFDQIADITHLDSLYKLVKVNGHLVIQYSDLENIDGLSNLATVGGDVNIVSNWELQNLDGFSSLTSVGGGLYIGSNYKLLDLDELSGITSVGGDVVIWENDKLIDLDGLSGLTSVGGYLSISYNDKLLELDGLSGLTSVGGDLYIWYNDRLLDLDGLSALTFVNDIDISHNLELRNLDGLSALTSVSDVLIWNNPELRSLEGLSALTSVSNEVGLYDLKMLSLGTAFSALEETGSLYIQRTTLQNLDAFSNLKTINNTLSIVGNTNLTDISGLTNVDYNTIDEIDIKYNNSLSICNLPNICAFMAGDKPREVINNAGSCTTAADILIACSPECSSGDVVLSSQAEVDAYKCRKSPGSMTISGDDITNLDALSKLESIEGNLIIKDNPNLLNVNGLSALKKVRALEISNNDELKGLHGLSALDHITGSLSISSNDELTDISGLANVEGTIFGLTITSNPLLSTCDLPFICADLSGPLLPGMLRRYNIQDNAAGCSSITEIRISCQPDVTAVEFQPNLLVSYGTTWSEVSALLPDKVNITLEDGSTENVSVSWQQGAYDGTIPGFHALEGILINGPLPVFNNPSNKTVRKYVGVQLPDLASVSSLPDVQVGTNTSWMEASALLPDSVVVFGPGNLSMKVAVSWAQGSYDGSDPGTYIVHGNLIHNDPATFQNTYNLQASIRILVVSAITSVSALPDKQVDYGTSWMVVSAMLTGTVEVHLDDGTSENVNVMWQQGTYDGTTPGKHDIEGTLILPENAYISNPSNLKAINSVNVSLPEIASVSSLPDVQVDYNASWSDVSALLPDSVEVFETGGLPLKVGVSWVQGIYDGSVRGTYTINGNLVHNDPATFQNTSNLQAGIRIQVVSAITSVSPLPDNQVDYGTSWMKVSATLPGTVEVNLDDGTSENLSVMWQQGTYDGTAPGKHDIEGILILPENAYISNPSNLKALNHIYVTVPVISSVTALPDVLVPYGSSWSEASALLPAVAEVYETGGLSLNAGVSWQEGTYNGFVPGIYEIGGNLVNTDPASFENPSSLGVSIRIQVLKPPVRTVEQLSEIVVCYGTEWPEINEFPSAVRVWTEAGDQENVGVDWQEEAYDSETPGMHKISGLLILPPSAPFSNSAGLKATLTISVLPFLEAQSARSMSEGDTLHLADCHPPSISQADLDLGPIPFDSQVEGNIFNADLPAEPGYGLWKMLEYEYKVTNECGQQDDLSYYVALHDLTGPIFRNVPPDIVIARPGDLPEVPDDVQIFDLCRYVVWDTVMTKPVTDPVTDDTLAFVRRWIAEDVVGHRTYAQQMIYIKKKQDYNTITIRVAKEGDLTGALFPGAAGTADIPIDLYRLDSTFSEFVDSTLSRDWNGKRGSAFFNPLPGGRYQVSVDVPQGYKALSPSGLVDSSGWSDTLVIAGDSVVDLGMVILVRDSISAPADSIRFAETIQDQDILLHHSPVKSFQIRAYPNPSDGIVRVEISKTGPHFYKIYDHLGRLVVKGVLTSGSAIDFSDQSDGLYFLQVRGKEGPVRTVRLIIAELQ